MPTRFFNVDEKLDPNGRLVLLHDARRRNRTDIEHYRMHRAIARDKQGQKQEVAYRAPMMVQFHRAKSVIAKETGTAGELNNSVHRVYCPS